MKWTKKKPKFNKDSKECLLLVAVKIHNEWEYSLYQMKKMHYEETWYWGILTGEGDEWGDYVDFRAHLYYTMPLLKG